MLGIMRQISLKKSGFYLAEINRITDFKNPVIRFNFA